eukprot:1054892-Pelagomonas_calceolata.AAC.2
MVHACKGAPPGWCGAARTETPEPAPPGACSPVAGSPGCHPSPSLTARAGAACQWRVWSGSSSRPAGRAGAPRAPGRLAQHLHAAFPDAVT